MTAHIPVLLDAVIDALQPADSAARRLVDGTVGGGGHTGALLAAGIDQVLAMDRDAEAIETARKNLAGYGERVYFYHGSYVETRRAMRSIGWRHADAILLDLGLSSLQLDARQRGFSFRYNAPLDMRFDTSAGATAAELLNRLSQADLADIFFRYGEERFARRIASAIVRQRPIETTGELANLIERAIPTKRHAKIHPATRVFQALRIAVNDELSALESALPLAIESLRPGGRLAVISFHSLEDRIVKRFFRERATSLVAPPGMASLGERRASIKLVNRKPITPSRAEVRANPRSRSAKLRVVVKL